MRIRSRLEDETPDGDHGADECATPVEQQLFSYRFLPHLRSDLQFTIKINRVSEFAMDVSAVRAF